MAARCLNTFCEPNMNTTQVRSTDFAGATPDRVPGNTGCQARQYHARLVMQDGERYCALTDAGAIWVVAAAGCLLQPALGDIVLVSATGAKGYVLTVLEREHKDETAVLSVQGHARLRARGGRMEIAAEQGLAVDAGTGLVVSAQTAHVSVASAKVDCEALAISGTQMQSHWERRTDIAREHVEIAASSESHLGRSTRRIAGHEEVSADSSRQLVARDLTVRAGTATLVGRDRIAVDGDSVQIG